MASNDQTSSGNIVVGVDGSPSSEHAVIWAAEEAHLQHRGLTLIHAQQKFSADQLSWIGASGVPPHQINDEIRQDANRIVERALALASGRFPEVPVEAVIDFQDARHLLLAQAEFASMAVVGTRGHGLVAGLLLGSVSGALVRHAQTPVVVVRPQPEDGRGVLIAMDGSEASLELAEHAFWEASLHGSALTVVHCLWDALMAQARWTSVSDSDPEGEEVRLRIAESVAGMNEKFPDVSVRIKVTKGAIDAALVDLSAEYDLLVIGRPTRPLLLRLTQSGLTLPVAEHAHCPVLVIP